MFFFCLVLLCLCAPLGSRLWCLTVSLSLSHCYPGSGLVLDLSIPDLCTLTYFVRSIYLMRQAKTKNDWPVSFRINYSFFSFNLICVHILKEILHADRKLININYIRWDFGAIPWLEPNLKLRPPNFGLVISTAYKTMFCLK